MVTMEMSVSGTDMVSIEMRVSVFSFWLSIPIIPAELINSEAMK